MKKNHELYKRSFDKLHPSESFQKELLEQMEQNKYTRGKRVRRCLFLAATVAVIASLAIAASASGLVQTVSLWINGQEVDPADYMDENGVITLETENEDEEFFVEYRITETGDKIHVQYDDPSAGETEDSGNLPQIDGTYETENGRDYLILKNRDTGEQERLDITGQMTDGVYRDTVEVFGCRCTVDLRVADDSVSIGLSVDLLAE